MTREFCEKNEGEKSGECSIPTLPCLAADEVYCMYVNLLLLCRCFIPAVAVLLAVGGITLFFRFFKYIFNSDIKER